MESSISVYIENNQVGTIHSDFNIIFGMEDQKFKSLSSLLTAINNKKPNLSDYNKLEFKIQKKIFPYKDLKDTLKGNGPNRILSIKEVLKGKIIEEEEEAIAKLKRYEKLI